MNEASVMKGKPQIALRSHQPASRLERQAMTLLAANARLRRRTLDLAASNRLLKKEIARRQLAEHTLFQSEQHTSRLLAQSRRRQEQLRRLSRQVLSAQEEERKRISRELHDVIAQLLTGIHVQLTILRKAATVNAKGFAKNIARTQQLVEKSVDIVHRFARELRPAMLDDLGLIPALRSFVKRFTRETGLPVNLTAFAGVERLSSAKRTVLYRVAQEALANVAHHAHATRVEARIQRLPKGVRMEIEDNGKSFDAEQMMHAGKSKRMGLLGMRERVEMVGGCFGVESAPGRGTTIRAEIPFTNVKRG